MKLLRQLIACQLLWGHAASFSPPKKGVRTKYSEQIPVDTVDLEQQQQSSPASSLEVSRSVFCHQIFLSSACAFVSSINPSPSFAFEGGVGGLGKTKPSTGVELFNADAVPIQNAQGIIQAEITSATGKPLLVQFQSPWPLLSTTSGLEARDVRNSESAFIQVLTLTKNTNWRDKKVFSQLLLDTVLGSQGKFGAYGTPVDVKVKTLKKKNESVGENDVAYSVSFTSYTPSMRESERQLWIKPKQLDEYTLVLLVTGTTSLRFGSQESTFQHVIDSFDVTAAPESRLRKDFTGLQRERQL